MARSRTLSLALCGALLVLLAAPLAAGVPVNSFEDNLNTDDGSLTDNSDPPVPPQTETDDLVDGDAADSGSVYDAELEKLESGNNVGGTGRPGGRTKKQATTICVQIQPVGQAGPYEVCGDRAEKLLQQERMQRMQQPPPEYGYYQQDPQFSSSLAGPSINVQAPSGAWFRQQDIPVVIRDHEDPNRATYMGSFNAARAAETAATQQGSAPASTPVQQPAPQQQAQQQQLAQQAAQSRQELQVQAADQAALRANAAASAAAAAAPSPAPAPAPAAATPATPEHSHTSARSFGADQIIVQQGPGTRDTIILPGDRGYGSRPSTTIIQQHSRPGIYGDINDYRAARMDSDTPTFNSVGGSTSMTEPKVIYRKEIIVNNHPQSATGNLGSLISGVASGIHAAGGIGAIASGVSGALAPAAGGVAALVPPKKQYHHQVPIPMVLNCDLNTLTARMPPIPVPPSVVNEVVHQRAFQPQSANLMAQGSLGSLQGRDAETYLMQQAALDSLLRAAEEEKQVTIKVDHGIGMRADAQKEYSKLLDELKANTQEQDRLHEALRKLKATKEDPEPAAAATAKQNIQQEVPKEVPQVQPVKHIVDPSQQAQQTVQSHQESRTIYQPTQEFRQVTNYPQTMSAQELLDGMSSQPRYVERPLSPIGPNGAPTVVVNMRPNGFASGVVPPAPLPGRQIVVNSYSQQPASMGLGPASPYYRANEAGLASNAATFYRADAAPAQPTAQTYTTTFQARAGNPGSHSQEQMLKQMREAQEDMIRMRSMMNRSTEEQEGAEQGVATPAPAVPSTKAFSGQSSAMTVSPQAQLAAGGPAVGQGVIGNLSMTNGPQVYAAPAAPAAQPAPGQGSPAPLQGRESASNLWPRYH